MESLNANTNSQTNITDLPFDLLLLTTRWLSTDDVLFGLSLTCKTLNQVVTKACFLWTRLDISTIPSLDDSSLIRIARKCPNASHIVIDDLPQTKSFLDCLNALKVNCCPQLRWVSIMGWDFSWENIQNPAVVELCTANPPLFNIARITPKHVILAHHIIYLCHKMMIPPAFVAMHAWFVLLSVEVNNPTLLQGKPIDIGVICTVYACLRNHNYFVKMEHLIRAAQAFYTGHKDAKRFFVTATQTCHTAIQDGHEVLYKTIIDFYNHVFIFEAHHLIKQARLVAEDYVRFRSHRLSNTCADPWQGPFLTHAEPWKNAPLSVPVSALDSVGMNASDYSSHMHSESLDAKIQADSNREHSFAKSTQTLHKISERDPIRGSLFFTEEKENKSDFPSIPLLIGSKPYHSDEFLKSVDQLSTSSKYNTHEDRFTPKNIRAFSSPTDTRCRTPTSDADILLKELEKQGDQSPRFNEQTKIQLSRGSNTSNPTVKHWQQYDSVEMNSSSHEQEKRNKESHLAGIQGEYTDQARSTSSFQDSTNNDDGYSMVDIPLPLHLRRAITQWDCSPSTLSDAAFLSLPSSSMSVSYSLSGNLSHSYQSQSRQSCSSAASMKSQEGEKKDVLLPQSASQENLPPPPLFSRQRSILPQRVAIASIPSFPPSHPSPQLCVTSSDPVSYDNKASLSSQDFKLLQPYQQIHNSRTNINAQKNEAKQLHTSKPSHQRNSTSDPFLYDFKSQRKASEISQSPQSSRKCSFETFETRESEKAEKKQVQDYSSSHKSRYIYPSNYLASDVLPCISCILQPRSFTFPKTESKQFSQTRDFPTSAQTEAHSTGSFSCDNSNFLHDHDKFINAPISSDYFCTSCLKICEKTHAEFYWTKFYGSPNTICDKLKKSNSLPILCQGLCAEKKDSTCKETYKWENTPGKSGICCTDRLIVSSRKSDQDTHNVSKSSPFEYSEQSTPCSVDLPQIPGLLTLERQTTFYSPKEGVFNTRCGKKSQDICDSKPRLEAQLSNF